MYVYDTICNIHILKEVTMFKYILTVSMADEQLSITDPMIMSLLRCAITKTNSSKNSKLKGRHFELASNYIDKDHVNIILKSNNEVIPSRAMSSLSRAIIAEDKNNIISSYRGCIFNSKLTSNQIVKTANLSDVELLQEIIAMVFGQQNLRNNKDKALARKYTDKIRSLIIEYIQSKSL